MHCGILCIKYIFCCMRIKLGWQDCELKENRLTCMETKIRFSMLYFVHKYRNSPIVMQLGLLELVYDIY
jgi:imidazoleglycerol phosphate synthase glutamine amidotransferase subunit HisH